MENRILRSVFGCLFLIASLMVGAQEGHQQPFQQEYFAKCQLSIQETGHLKHGKSTGCTDNPFCSIGLMFPNNLFIEPRASVFVFGKGLLEREGNEVGFIQGKNGSWSFAGTDLLLSSKMLKTSFTQEQSGSETVLVGYQLIRGNIAQGGPITLPGIRILRITPEFVVSVELNFQPTHYEKQNKGYKQLREAVSKELVDVVKSVQLEPGTAGPTVRPAALPINP